MTGTDNDGLAETRKVLDGRYDDLKTARVRPIDGEEFFEDLRRREDGLLRKLAEILKAEISPGPAAIAEGPGTITSLRLPRGREGTHLRLARWVAEGDWRCSHPAGIRSVRIAPFPKNPNRRDIRRRADGSGAR